MKGFAKVGIATLLAFSASGCAVGYNYTLFMTKSNVGIDIDSRPPTAEISVARREVVVEPTFEGGQTLPVFASFKEQDGVLSALFFGVSSMFAGGNAAVILTDKQQDQTTAGGATAASSSTPRTDTPPQGTAPPPACGQEAGELCLSEQPMPTGEVIEDLVWWPGKGWQLPGAGKIKPFVFATDTALGLKIAWSGTTAQYPDSVKLGFNRKEFAFAPVFGETKPDEHKIRVKMPSFIAGVAPRVGGILGWPRYQSSFLQYFATGAAAQNLAKLTSIRDQRDKMLTPTEPVAQPQGQPTTGTSAPGR